MIAYHIGDKGTHSAIAIDQLAKQAVGNISHIYTDANSCYRLTFKRHEVREPHAQAFHVLKAKLQREGIFREMRMREAFEKPSVRKAREKVEAISCNRPALIKWG